MTLQEKIKELRDLKPRGDGQIFQTAMLYELPKLLDVIEIMTFTLNKISNASFPSDGWDADDFIVLQEKDFRALAMETQDKVEELFRKP